MENLIKWLMKDKYGTFSLYELNLRYSRCRNLGESIMNKTINLTKIEEETLSPEMYLGLNPKDRANIASTKIIPARLGKADFGKIRVTYKTPTYKISR
jgi:hypothetical protein